MTAPEGTAAAGATRKTAATFTYSQMRVEAERELMLRRRVYPNRVATQRMSQSEAERQIALMRAIRDVLRELEKTELLL